MFYKKGLRRILNTEEINLGNNVSNDFAVDCMLSNNKQMVKRIFTKDERLAFYSIKYKLSTRFNSINTRCKNKQYLAELKKMLILDYDEKHKVLKQKTETDTPTVSPSIAHTPAVSQSIADTPTVLPSIAYTPTVLPSIESDLFPSLQPYD